MILELNYHSGMALICSPKIIYRRLILITIFVCVLCEIIGGNRNFRFCEIVNKRDLTFTLAGINVTFYNQTLSTCASLCIANIECSWFTYNVQLTKCLILTIPTFQNVVSGTIELGIRHYALTVGK